MTADRRETFYTGSADATLELAEQVGRLLTGGEVLALVGDLGAGKTTFVKGLCRGLDLVDMSQVSSPSYVLEHIYEARLVIHHFDAYRLESSDEFLALGFEEHLGSDRDVMFVEWADRVAAALPAERLSIDIDYAAEADVGGSPLREGRTLVLSGRERIWGALLDELRGGLASHASGLNAPGGR